MEIIFGSVLALLVVGFVVLGLTTYGLLRRMLEQGSKLGTLSTQYAQLHERVDRTSTAKLRVAVDDLAATVEALSVSNRREFGRLWQRVRPADGKVLDGETGAVIGDASDPDLGAMLDLQRAGPAGP